MYVSLLLLKNVLKNADNRMEDLRNKPLHSEDSRNILQ